MSVAANRWTVNQAYLDVRRITATLHDSTSTIRVEWGWRDPESYRVIWIVRGRTGATVLLNAYGSARIERVQVNLSDVLPYFQKLESLPTVWRSAGRPGLTDGYTYLLCACDANGCRGAGLYDALQVSLQEGYPADYVVMRDYVKTVVAFSEQLGIHS
jgi:hypothetical protein